MYNKLPTKARAQVLLDKLFNDEIDDTTFNAGIELLKHSKKNDGGLTGYA